MMMGTYEFRGITAESVYLRSVSVVIRDSSVSVSAYSPASDEATGS